ncbi:MAG: DUF1624 domain-containing protein [Sphingomonas sp.]|uniref:DUF1624 domain-containing protein n=1 Tax=Sphingomonas sp. TaxID=28214 RepID=UPI001B1202A3|nr:heparan-alpha-glucosaminide N-acetyltransferase domain-containing protein [Sphingomonas sp.]MBO9621577.1 DUF1624 domain-containing protein [Sphingomonas sp.]
MIQASTERQPSTTNDEGLTRTGSPRVGTIDALRGLVLVLMVLDHVRDFFHRGALIADPLALDSGDPLLFMTRWVTHLCAPTFVFLSGVSIWLQHANGKSVAELRRFLLARGIWLILLELTIVGVGFNFGWWIFLQVIWAIGAGMIALAGLLWLPRMLILLLGIGILVLHPLMGAIPAEAFGDWSIAWRAFAVFGPVATPAGFALVAYPAIPWIGIMLFGYGLGPLFNKPAGRRNRDVLAIACVLLAGFFLLRWFNVPGLDPRAWSRQPEALWTVLSFLNVSKYPPSPAYVALMLGLSLLVFRGLEGRSGAVVGVLRTFGRTPLFTYLLHIWLAHGLAVLAGATMGVPVAAFANWIVDPSRLIEAGWGLSLAGAYLFWAITLALLYPLSRWFDHVKRTRRDRWLGYL